ncbi:hypothetical protein K530_54450 [Streptomyces noursei CCRC 11814]|nr:hypothetical protein K530_54450 [Streptomyces noursei CCRC 11814]
MALRSFLTAHRVHSLSSVSQHFEALTRRSPRGGPAPDVGRTSPAPPWNRDLRLVGRRH